MTPTLTIAIPTWNRNDLLRRHVAMLLPQMTNETRLVIYDNASPTPVADTLADLIRQHPNAQVTINRNRVNIGSSANVMRCFEQCESRWLWVLGDDDRPLPDAVATALTAIREHGECVMINCSSKEKNPDGAFETQGVEDFAKRTPSFANLTLISNNLYRADRLADHVRTGYFFAYSLFPHLACVLSALQTDGGRCCFTSAQLVEWGPDSHWSRIMSGAGIGMMLDLPVPHRVRRLLIPPLVGLGGNYSSLSIMLLDQIGVTIDAPTARYIYEQAYQRLYRHKSRGKHQVYRWLGHFMMWMPGLSLAAYRTYRRLRGNPRTPLPDHMARM